MDETVRVWRFGAVTARLVLIKGSGQVSRPDLPSRVWRRAVLLAAELGAERALEICDARAERSLEQTKPEAAVRWRDLMVALHAVSGTEDDGRPFDA